MKTYLLIIIIIFASIFSEAETINPQFVIDVLTGKTAVVAKPCSGPPGSGCENVVPQMSVERHETIQTRHAKPEPQMTPANPIEYARQQIPYYPQYPIWGYQTRIPIQPVQPWQIQQRLRQEVAMIYNLSETTEEYNRRVSAEIAARQATEKAQTIKTDALTQEVIPVPLATSQEPQKHIFSVSASAYPVSNPLSLATRSFVIPSWFYEILGWIGFGITATIFAFWGMKILLRT